MIEFQHQFSFTQGEIMSDFEPTPIPEIEPKKKSNTVLIISIVAVVLICCCCACLATFGWTFGDQILYELGI
jgi:hypothetical protein